VTREFSALHDDDKPPCEYVAIYGAPVHPPNAVLHFHSTVISHAHGDRGSGGEEA